MLDITLDRDGDIRLSPTGDISLTDSVRQAILIRLRWIYNEWWLGTELGFPWFEEVFVKNPDKERIRGLVRDKIGQVENAKNIKVSKAVYDPAARTLSIAYSCTVGDEIFQDEVILNE